MSKKKIYKVSFTTEIARCIWLLVGLMRSLKSSHKEVVKTPLLCDDKNGLTSPTSSHTRYTLLFLLYMTHFKNYFFMHEC